MGKPHILIVDDDPDICTLLLGYLANDFEVETFCDPLDAASRIEQGGFDCLLTDLYMKGWRGLDLIHMVRDRFPKIPIIIMTGQASDHPLTRQAIEADVDGLLRKPLGTPSQVVSYLQKQVRQSSR